MRKLFYIILIAIVASLSCGNESKSTTSDDFKIKPGDVTKFSSTISDASYNVTFGNVTRSGTYAIIFQKNINGTDYVGIAFGEDPKSNRKFKVYISWQSSSISDYNGTASVTVIDSPGIRYGKQDANINFEISGPNGNIYSIKSSDNITVTDGATQKTLIFSGDDTIKAYLVQ